MAGTFWRAGPYLVVPVVISGGRDEKLFIESAGFGLVSVELAGTDGCLPGGYGRRAGGSAGGGAGSGANSFELDLTQSRRSAPESAIDS
jgi:hypothetical protein